MAWRRRGAPVRLCKPAPHVEKKDPITMTHGVGQASVPTTKFLFTASPYLWGGGGENLSFKKRLEFVWYFHLIFNYLSKDLLLISSKQPNSERKIWNNYLLISKNNAFNASSKQQYTTEICEVQIQLRKPEFWHNKCLHSQ